jgi:hypothetical protein
MDGPHDFVHLDRQQRRSRDDGEPACPRLAPVQREPFGAHQRRIGKGRDSERCLPCDGEVPGRAHGPVEEVGRQRQMDGQRGACHEIDGIGLSRREKDHADDREARAFEGFERNDPRQERCGLLQTTSAGTAVRRS